MSIQQLTKRVRCLEQSSGPTLEELRKMDPKLLTNEQLERVYRALSGMPDDVDWDDYWEKQLEQIAKGEWRG